MDSLFGNIAVGLFSGIVAGLVTGFYSGLVVSRFVRFTSLCSEAHRAMNSIEYMQEHGRVMVSRNDSSAVPLVAADLIYFGHKSAGIRVDEEHKNVADAMLKAEQGKLEVKDLEEVLNQARHGIRRTRPALRILLPWGRV
ncbi:hypothetical protein [Chromohalobacter canadensis]|uniref:hypothetical protein n=1 Tax=Chromohalobacter canadensis TaxID=141389 RepID=UPI00240FF2BE|nr:hypothetical protein [Chromohalobacter canadensis]